MNDPSAPIKMPAAAGITSRAVAFGESLVRYAVDWIDDRRFVTRHRQFIEELDRTGELDGLLEAMGLTREQLHSFVISPLASAELLAGLMVRIGIGAADIQADGESIELRCRTCANWRQCRHWLERGADADGYGEFCPNADLLDRLRTRRGPAC